MEVNCLLYFTKIYFIYIKFEYKETFHIEIPISNTTNVNNEF